MTARIDVSDCPCPSWLPGGLSQTLYSATIAHHHQAVFVRERVDTPDGDFIDFDWLAPRGPVAGSGTGRADRIDAQLAHTAARRWMRDADQRALAASGTPNALILFHGLEGGSGSPYAQAIAHHFLARNWAVVVAHFRGCSGFPNRMARAYHSGDSADLAFMLMTARKHLPRARWHGVGISLGGNALLKCLGDHPQTTAWLTAVAGICVPLDLVACGNRLSTSPIVRQLCAVYFLRPMKRKLIEKARRFPGTVDVLRASRIKTLRDFDDLYTAPLHGYENALDYWTRASSKSILKSLHVPALVLNARNDPFVPAPSLPATRDCSDEVLLHQPARGGHVGFTSGPFPGHSDWLPARIERFFRTGS